MCFVQIRSSGHSAVPSLKGIMCNQTLRAGYYLKLAIPLCLINTINPDHMKECVLEIPLKSRLHFIPPQTVTPQISWKGIAHGYPAPPMSTHARPAGENKTHTHARSPLVCLHRHQLRTLLLASLNKRTAFTHKMQKVRQLCCYGVVSQHIR